MTKIKAHHRKDFSCYVSWGRRSRMKHSVFNPFLVDPDLNASDGVSAIQWYAHRESTGKDLPCRDADGKQMALEGKAILNWQIKQWAEGVAKWLFFTFEFVPAFPELPEWAWLAVEQQARQLRYGR